MNSFADLAHTVTTVSVTPTQNNIGDTTFTESTSTHAGVLYAPEGLQENTDAESARVIGDASLYGDLPRLRADDLIRHAGSCCDGVDFTFGEWQVVGGTRGWGKGLKVVAIRLTGEA